MFNREKGTLISLHMPKAGGTSFHKLLLNYFGAPHLKEDYIDFPLNRSFEERYSMAKKFDRNFRAYNRFFYKFKKIQCIHGHFLPYKYNSFIQNENNLFVTWLRDPLERLGSHYHFWIRSYDVDKSPALHRKVVEENWSFEAFCFSKELRNVYSQFFWNFPLDRFDFIGLMEFFDEDCKYFGDNFLGITISDVPQRNLNPNSSNSYFNDLQFKNELQKFHEKDYVIYEYALKQREKRR